MFLVLRALDNNLKYSTRTSLLRGCTTVGRRTVTGSSSLCKTHYCWILPHGLRSSVKLHSVFLTYVLQKESQCFGIGVIKLSVFDDINRRVCGYVVRCSPTMHPFFMLTDLRKPHRCTGHQSDGTFLSSRRSLMFPEKLM